MRWSYPESGGEKIMENLLGWFILIIGVNLIFMIWFFNRWRDVSIRRGERKDHRGKSAYDGNRHLDDHHMHEGYGIEPNEEEDNLNGGDAGEFDTGDDSGFDAGDDF